MFGWMATRHTRFLGGDTKMATKTGLLKSHRGRTKEGEPRGQPGELDNSCQPPFASSTFRLTSPRNTRCTTKTLGILGGNPPPSRGRRHGWALWAAKSAVPAA